MSAMMSSGRFSADFYWFKLYFSLHFIPLDPDSESGSTDPNESGSGSASLYLWVSLHQFTLYIYYCYPTYVKNSCFMDAWPTGDGHRALGRHAGGHHRAPDGHEDQDTERKGHFTACETRRQKLAKFVYMWNDSQWMNSNSCTFI